MNKLLIIIFLIFDLTIISCIDKDPHKENFADVISIEKINDRHIYGDYRIAINEYCMQNWSSNNIIIKIDSSATTTKAIFFSKSNKIPSCRSDIILVFSNEEKAQKAINTELFENNNKSFIKINNNNRSCFISTILGEN